MLSIYKNNASCLINRESDNRHVLALLEGPIVLDFSGAKPRPAQWIGRPLQRIEDERLLRGAGCFVDDLEPAGCLFVEIVRSVHPAGRIVSIDLDGARDLPGVVRVFSAADVAGLGSPAVNPLLPDMQLPAFELFACERIGALGQPLAAIVATSATVAKDAAQLIAVDIEPDEAPPLSSETAVSHVWTAGNVDAAFAAAAHVVTIDIEHARLAPFALELRSALAAWDGERQLLTVWLSTQTPHRARSDLAVILALPTERLRVVAPDVGGAFGGKASIYPEDIIVAFASFTLRAPVKWTASRSEEFLSATQGRGATTRAWLAVSEGGRFLGLKADLAFPLGHWLPYSAAAPVNNAGRILPGPYRVPAIRIHGHAEVRNTAAVNIYRGAGRPEATMLMERLVEEAARHLSLDPIKLRHLNAVASTYFPHASGTGAILDSGDYPRLLDIACSSAGYLKLRQDCARMRRAGAICGVGAGLYVEPCGQGWESASIHIEPDGRIVAATGSTSQGQGRQTAFSQIVGDVLLLSPHEIQLNQGDTDTTPPGIGALASRSSPIGGSALLLAAQEFRKTSLGIAAQILRIAGEDTVLVPGGFSCVNDSAQFVSWEQIAKSSYEGTVDCGERPENLKADIVYHADGEAWSSGCVIAAVSIEGETGELSIDTLTWVDDAGPVLNPLLLEGQLLGGMAQGVGEALMEQLIYDDEGQLLTGSLMDYTLPRASDVPLIDLRKLETRSPANILGVKGAGEAGCIGIPAAILNAAIDALRPLGVRTIDMPLTSARIWQAMKDSEKENP